MVTKIIFNPKIIASNPEKALRMIKKQVIHTVGKGEEIDLGAFSHSLYLLKDSFQAANKKDIMNERFKKLAVDLVANNGDNLAGVVYSLLIKLNKGNIKLIKDFATCGLAIAKKLNDQIHIAARSNDLREIYQATNANDDTMLKILIEERDALSNIINNYDCIQKQHNTIKKNIKPIKNYEITLAEVKFELGKRLAFIKPEEAKKELLYSRKVFEEINYQSKVQYIDNYIKVLTQ